MRAHGLRTQRSLAQAALIATLAGVPQADAAPGELDAAFGAHGLVRTGAEGNGQSAAAVVATSDGHLLLASNGLRRDGEPFLSRVNPDGTPDASFGSGGQAWPGVPGSFTTFALIQQQDGNIVAGGIAHHPSSTAFTSEPLVVARFLPDGRIDTSFGDGGVARADFSTPSLLSSARANALVLQSDGKLVAAGAASYLSPWDYSGFGDHGSVVLARFDATGVLDAGFGNDGRVVVSPAGGLSGVRGLAQQSDGKLVAVGSIGADIAVIRLSRDGALDTSFASNGIATLALQNPANVAAFATAVAVRSDGKIVVGGTSLLSCDDHGGDCAIRETVVVRLEPDGVADTTFGENGIVTFNAAGKHTELASGGLVLEQSGAFVVGGNTESVHGGRYGFLARFTATGTLDFGFGSSGVVHIDTGTDGHAPNATMAGMARLPDGKIAAALTAHATDGTPLAVVARVTTTGGHPGVIGFERTRPAVAERTDGTFSVRRSGGATGRVSIDYATRILPADALSADSMDFTATAGTLHWLDGDSSERTIAIPIATDAAVENRERFALDLSNPGGGASLAARTAHVEIVDVNDGAGVLQFDAPSATVREGSIADEINVTRSGGSTGAVSVSYRSTALTATHDSDFAALNGQLLWAHGETGSKSVRLSIATDGIAEPTESFLIILVGASGGARLGNTRTAEVSITDAESTTSGSSSSARSIGGGGGGIGTIELLLLALSHVLGTLGRYALKRRAGAPTIPEHPPASAGP